MELKQRASSTGFRILFILDLLLKGPASKNEILDTMSKNPLFLNSTITKETISLNINTLKKAGFEIENLGKAHNYRYKINWSPIKFKLTEDEMEILTSARDAVIELSEIDYIIKLYRLFLKIANYIEDKDKINELLDFGYFLNVNFDIVKELNALSKRKKEVILLYNSPNSGKKEIQIKLCEIKYSNLKLYITGYTKLYPNKTVLRADNVVKILKILPETGAPKKLERNKFTCKIRTGAKDRINFLNEETIINEDKNFITIEIKPDNVFFAVQRLLSFGEDLVSIDDKKIKAEYIKVLKNVHKLY